MNSYEHHFGITGPIEVGPTGPTGPTGSTGEQGPGTLVSTGFSSFTGLVDMDLPINSIQPFICYAKTDNYIEIWGTVNYGGDFTQLFLYNKRNIQILSVTISPDQIGLDPTSNVRVNESVSIGMFTVPVLYPNYNNFSLSGRIVFQNVSATEINLLFELGKPFNIRTGGTLGQFTFKASCLTETTTPIVICPSTINPQLVGAPICVGGLEVFDTTDVLGPIQFGGPITPPNCTIASNGRYTIAVINRIIALYLQTLNGLKLSDNKLIFDFFGNNINPPATSNDFISDPWIVYDQFSEQFVLAIFRIYNNNQGDILLAVSKQGTKFFTLDQATWNYYSYDLTYVPGPSGITGPCFPDFPRLGYDDTAYYISTNNFFINPRRFYSSTVIYINKATITDFKFIDGITDLCTPIQQYDSKNTFFCIKNSYQDPNFDAGIILYAIDKNTGDLIATGFITFQGPGALSIPPHNIPQPDPNIRFLNIDPDLRYDSAVLQDNKIWTVISISYPGFYDTNGNPKTFLRWAKINLQDWPLNGDPIIEEYGILAGNDTLLSNDNLGFPHINIDIDNNVAIGCTICGINRFASIAVLGYLSNSEFSNPLVLYSGNASVVTGVDVRGINRWGDWSGLALDPSDNITFWQFNEYASNVNVNPNWIGSWGSVISKYQLDSSDFQTPTPPTTGIPRKLSGPNLSTFSTTIPKLSFIPTSSI